MSDTVTVEKLVEEKSAVENVVEDVVTATENVVTSVPKDITPPPPAPASGKHALLIGINYEGSPNQLSGCRNDVYNMKEYLLTQGYSEENITVMTDDAKNRHTFLFPSCANFMVQVRKLIRPRKAGDKLFFHYSGHGSQTKDLDGDEESGKDECICLYDPDSSVPSVKINSGIEFLIDDILRVEMVDALPDGVELVAFFDSCHSETILDLPFNFYPTQGIHRDKFEKASTKDVISISGCLDPSTSADTSFNGKPSGALTGYALKLLKGMRVNTTWTKFVILLDHELYMGKYSQVSALAFCDQKKLDAAVMI